MSADASPAAGEVVSAASSTVTGSTRRAYRRVLIVLNPHLANCCVLRLDEQIARTLHGIFGEWLG